MSNILTTLNHFGDTQPALSIGFLLLLCAFACIPLATERK